MPREKPLTWVRRSCTRISRVTYGSFIANQGSRSTTRSFHPSFPSSTSIARIAAVVALVLLATWNTVLVSTRSGLPSFRTPYPRAKTVRPSFTTAMAMPGVWSSAMARWT